jgi:hypothetical protein
MWHSARFESACYLHDCDVPQHTTVKAMVTERYQGMGKSLPKGTFLKLLTFDELNIVDEYFMSRAAQAA